MITRRNFLELAPIPFAALPLRLWAATFPEKQPAGALFPCPARDSEAGVNPPGFAWWRAEGAERYRLLIRDARGSVVYRAEALGDPVHLPDRTLRPGRYSWDVEALDAGGKVLAQRGAWPFAVPAGVPELPWQDPREILARVPASHPRYIFLKDELPRIRQSLAAGRLRAWEDLREFAAKALQMPLPEPPRYHTFTGENRARMGYVDYFREFRRRVDNPLSALSLAYLLSGEERYGLRAKQLLLEIESWGIEGPMSVLSPFGDEPGLTMARHGHRAYDWLYPLFDSRERERAMKMTADRARQVLARLRRARYLASPAESHNGRLIAYLSEHAVVMKDEAPDAAEWLDYSLRGLTTFYPHWADQDGGWAEGISYALSYNTLYLGAIEALRAAAGFDLYKRPFFRNVRRFFIYCAAPAGEIRPFGDGAESGGAGGQGAALLLHHGRRFEDPACVWWAAQTGEVPLADPLIPMLTEDKVAPAPPTSWPAAAVFRGVGWAALHGALDDPKRDTFFLFKSSPFGSVSHSHADQNSFAVMKGGRALAIPSGYYGPAYGMPHHADWTRQTKANNCILVDGEGQAVRQHWASGRIAAFRHQKALSYVCGDAAQAYGGKLKKFLRHVLFLRPGIFLVLDELAATEPAEYRWLLHALEKMQIDESSRTLASERRGARMEVTLACDAALSFHQTDQFDTPYNQGNPPEYHQQVENQWHFTARTRKRASETRIGAVMVVRDDSEQWRTEWISQPGWLGIRVAAPDGTGEAWLQVTPGAKGPAFAMGRLLAARWRPTRGSAESLVI